MSSSSDPHAPNRLLAMLPPCVYAQLQTQLEPVELTLADYLQIPGEPLRHVYFPTGAVVILVCQVDRRPPLAVDLVAQKGWWGCRYF
jgi:hypothetical protein